VADRSARPSSGTGALDELTLTTNGTQLGATPAIADAGVRRINVSLDTLDQQKFTAITRWGRLEPVLTARSRQSGWPAGEDQCRGAQGRQ